MRARQKTVHLLVQPLDQEKRNASWTSQALGSAAIKLQGASAALVGAAQRGGEANIDIQDASSAVMETTAYLFQMAESLSHGATKKQLLTPGKEKGGLHYRSNILLQTLLLCDNIKDAAKLKQVVLQSLSLVFGSGSSFIDQVESMRMPSPATISRARLWLDTAYMGYMRKFFSSLPRMDRNIFTDLHR